MSVFLRQRVPQARHATMLLTPETILARELGQNRLLRVMGVGEEIIFGEKVHGDEIKPIYDRQIRAFGKDGQNVLNSMCIGIVGLGGTGSVVLQQLAHLGVRDFLLIDPDIIEDTNLNRVVGSVPSDVGKTKVAIAASWAKRINPAIHIETHHESVLKAEITRLLAKTDLIFCCTDSHGSRAVLNQFAYQYFVPMIDMGVVIITDNFKIKNIAGRVQLLSPGLACMVC